MNYKNLFKRYLEGDPDPATPPATPPPAADPAAAPPPAPAAAPELSSLLGDDYKEAAPLQDFKSVDALAKGYMDLKQYQGSSLRIPGEDAGDEARAEFNAKLSEVPGVMLRPDFDNPEQSKEFYRTLGAPEEATGYEFQMPENAPDMQVDNDRIEMFRQLAHKQGLTKTQFNNIMSNVVAADHQAATAAAAKKAEGVSLLRSEWGSAYDQNMNIATAVARATGAPEDMVAAVEAGQVGPNTLKWLHSLASRFEGEGQNLINRDPALYKETPAEVQDTISEIMGNPEHPYWQSGHPEHSKAVDKMLNLQRKLHTG